MTTPSSRDPGRFVVIAVGALFAAIGLIFAGIGVSMWASERSEQRRLDAAGRFAPAVIVRKYIEAVSTGSSTRPVFRLTYRFTPENAADHSATAAVDRATFERAKPGGRIEVVYLPGAPAIHRVEGAATDDLASPVFAMIGAVFVLVGGGMVYAMQRRPRPAPPRPGVLARAWNGVTAAPLVLFGAVWLLVGVPLLIAGVLVARSESDADARFAAQSLQAEGTVLSKAVVSESSGTGNNRHRTTKYRLTFRYLTQAGEEIVGTTDLAAGTWERLVERAPVTVAYMADAPWRYRVEDQGTGWSSWIGAYLLLGFGILGTAVGGVATAVAWRGLPALRRTDRAPRARARSRERPAPTTSVPPVPPAPATPALARAARFVPRGWVVPAVAAIFFVAGCAALIAGLATLVEELRFAREGVVVEGRITAKSVEEASRSERSATKYVVTYRFATANGEAAEGRHRLRRDAWESAREGDHIGVRYLASAPQTNRAADNSDVAGGLVGIVLGLIFASIGGSVLALIHYARRRRTRLLRRGVSAAATVIAAEPSSVTVNRVRQWQIRYQFRDAGGRQREGTSEPMAPAEANDWSPGDPGEVSYDPANPDDNIWTGVAPAATRRPIAAGAC